VKILIIGGGHAGTMAARILAKHHKVTWNERFLNHFKFMKRLESINKIKK